MTRPDLAAIRARCDAATRGPWSVSTLTYPNGTTVVESIIGVSEPQWCDYGEGEGEWYTDRLTLVETDAGVYGPTMPDAQFIAHARTDIPALLAHINALAERALTAEERLEQMTRERDKEREEWASRRCECSASDSCKMARERDEARERVLDAALIHAELVRERDEARAQLAATDTGSPCDGHRHCCADRRRLAEELLRVRAERDALKGKL